MEIKRFLGFTDNIKEPRKTKIENELRKVFLCDQIFYKSVCDFLCTKLIEGYYPEREENYQYYKQNGELSKPKTLYRYSNIDKRYYIELNKTQYDFVCYLLEKGLNTAEVILEYDKKDIEKQEALKQAEQAEKERQERKTEEKEQMRKFIAEESQHIHPEEKEIVDSIFFSIYGKENSWNYSLVSLIHNFDNPYCKEEIISRLHNDNKASIKIFECITGLKLPKSYKERKSYLEGLTQKDFKGITQYKPRKKREGKEIREKMQKEAFYILDTSCSSKKWTKVLAEHVKRYNIDMFIFCDKGAWNLSLAESGLKVTSGKTKAECLKNLKEIVDQKGEEAFIKLVQEQTELVNKIVTNQIGMNPRYRVS